MENRQGAINTFISEDMYYSIVPQERPVLDRARKQFQTADRSNLNIVGTTKIMFSFGPINVYFRVFVGN